MQSNVSITFANGGYVLHTFKAGDDEGSQEVFVSTGKLIKALRGAIEELSLLPKKAEADAE